MLRKTRIALAALSLACMALLFLDFTGTLHAWLGWMARVQLVPAMLAANLLVVLALAVLTLLLGRVYCSVICPLGITQDLISALHGRFRKNRFCHSREKRWLRWGFLALFIAALALGVGTVVSLLDPYAAFGRMAATLLQPAWMGCNNLLAAAAERTGSYAFYGVDVWMKGASTLVAAIATLAVVGVLAWRGGRTYCNTVCPVGTALGLLARFSLLKVRLDAGKCGSCGHCERNCKASAIDLKEMRIDHGRCVACGNCIAGCRNGALSFGMGRPAHAHGSGNGHGGIDQGRRSFLLGAALATGAAAMAQASGAVHGGLARIEGKARPRRRTPVTPPGSVSARNMARRCTACQLCVSACPNGVLRPSGRPETLMQPTASFERGYCRPECNRCSQVCPTGAIRPITVEERSSTMVGHAVWIRKNCLPVTDGVACSNCARHCPTGAITMVHPEGDADGPPVPAVSEADCIGCGACENLCPVRPIGAIYVEGYETHRLL